MDSLFDTYAPEPAEPNRVLQIVAAMAIALAVVVGAVLYLNRDHVTGEFRATASVAADSLARLQEAGSYSNALLGRTEGFEPRMIETEKSVDAVKRMATTESERDVAHSLDNWLTIVTNEHRLHSEGAEQAATTCDRYVRAVLAGQQQHGDGDCDRAFESLRTQAQN